MRQAPRRLAAVLAAAGLMLLAAPAAHAGLGVGDAAPDFEGRSFHNSDGVTLAGLRGRVILLELFSTT